MRKVMVLFLFICIYLWNFSQEDSFFLAGVQVHSSVLVKEEIKQLYLQDSLPVPAVLQSYVSEIHFVDQKVLDKQYSKETSGYTESYYQDGKCISSIIYLSNENFREETLLHEVLHVYDSYKNISNSDEFQVLASQEMDLVFHKRIVMHYDEDNYLSEYFVESAFSVILENIDYQKIHPLTVQYLKKVFKEDQIIA